MLSSDSKTQNAENPNADLLKDINQMSLFRCAVFLQLKTAKCSIDLNSKTMALPCENHCAGQRIWTEMGII